MPQRPMDDAYNTIGGKVHPKRNDTVEFTFKVKNAANYSQFVVCNPIALPDTNTYLSNYAAIPDWRIVPSDPADDRVGTVRKRPGDFNPSGRAFVIKVSKLGNNSWIGTDDGGFWSNDGVRNFPVVGDINELDKW